MVKRWIGYALASERGALAATVAGFAPGSELLQAESAFALRQVLHEEEPGAYGAVIGPCDDAVSDVNLAAALVRDGHAAEVLLVVRELSGSVVSRARKAGISQVIALIEAPVCVGTQHTNVSSGAASEAGSARVPTPWGFGTSGTSTHTDGGTSDGASDDGAPAKVTAAAGPSGRAPAGAKQGAGRPEGVGGSVITLASGRGGVGKTTICALMAYIASSWGMSVALLDLDLACGNLGSLFSCGRGPDLMGLAGLPVGTSIGDELARIGVSSDDGITIWGPCGLPEHAETVMPLAGRIIEELKKTHELVLVDTSSTCTDAVAQAMQGADRLVCVQGAGSGAVASLARVSALAVRLGVARTRIVRVESICEPRLWGKPVDPCVEKGLETARTYRVVEGTPDVLECLSAGEADELMALDDDLTRSVATLLAGMLHELGCLPADDRAARAARGAFVRKQFPLFGRRKEAV